jgi:hypothetical protein
MDSPPVPLPRVKSPPWHMNPGMTRWNADPLKCKTFPDLSWKNRISTAALSNNKKASKQASKQVSRSIDRELQNASSLLLDLHVPSSSLFSSTKTSKVLCRLGDDIGTQFHLDATLGRASNGNVKKDDWVFSSHSGGMVWYSIGKSGLLVSTGNTACFASVVYCRG